MSDTVKSIFKTIIAVPIIVCIVTFVFNIFAFTTSYFKLLGMSQVIQNVVIQNNYIPADELSVLEDSMDAMETAVLQNVHLVNQWNVTTKRQYGESVECGISARYLVAIPGMPVKNSADGPANQGTSQSQMFDNDPNTIMPDNPTGKTIFDRGIGVTITIKYTVPGMRYYPDMD